MNQAKSSCYLFVGVALMLLMASLFQSQNHKVSDYLVMSTLGNTWLPQLKIWSFATTLLTAFFLLGVTGNGRIDRAFKIILPINVVFYGAYALYANFATPNLDSPYFTAPFYMWTSVTSMTLMVMIFGLANQDYTFKNAAYQYPLFGLVLLLGPWLSTMLYEGTAKEGAKMIVDFSLLAVFVNSVIMGIFSFLSKRERGPEEAGKNVAVSYYVALAMIVFCINIPLLSSISYLKALAVELGNPRGYADFMAELAQIKGKSLLVTNVFGVLLGIILFLRGPAVLAWIGGAILLVSILGGGVVFLSTIGTLDTFTLERSALGSVVISVSVSLFLLLFKELCYFAIDWRYRFSAKITIDMILVLIVNFIPIITVLNFISNGGVESARGPLAALYFLPFIPCFIGIYWIHREMRQGLPGTTYPLQPKEK